MNRINTPNICEILATIFLVIAIGGVAFAAPFQNLDFTDTLLVPDEFGQLPSSFDFSAVLPHWDLFFENAEGTISVPLADYYFDGSFTALNIGCMGNVVLFEKYGFPGVPQSSLCPFPDFLCPSPDFLLYLENGDGDDLPVIVQTGEIPVSAKSIRIVIDDGDFTPPHFWARGGGKPVVRINGYEVILVEVPPNLEDEISFDGVVYAGNIEPIAGLTRNLRIGPTPSGFDFESTTLIDQITFSALSAPGPPVEVPEPTPLVLTLLAVLFSSSSRPSVIVNLRRSY